MTPTRSEMFFKGFDNSQLFLQTWFHEKSCGTILITHGQGEHSESYQRVINEFNLLSEQNKQLPWNFIAWDLRGHGRSNGLRGYARDIDDYVLDFECFINKVSEMKTLTQKPVLLMAHSMGGLIQTCALVENKAPFAKGQLMSAPFLGIGVTVPAWKDVGSEILNRYLPKITLGNELKNEMLSRDPEVIREYESDPYRHNKISSGVYLSAKREFKKLTSRFSEIELPTFMTISDNDPVVSSSAAMAYFDAIKSTQKGLKIVEGGAHELFNDVGRKDTIKSTYEFAGQLV